MAMSLWDQKIVSIRTRLLRRLVYRTWKSLAVARVKKLIGNVTYEAEEDISFSIPTIILSTYTKIEDFMVLTNLFREHDLTFIAPTNLPDKKIINRLKMFNQMLYIRATGFDFAFFKELLTALQNYNRSIVVSPDAGAQYLKSFTFNQSNLVRIAMKANVPIQPVIINWRVDNDDLSRQCNVFIAKRIFISPRHPDFKDIFFRRRGARKYSKLYKDEYTEIGDRIFANFKKIKGQYGTDVS